MSCHSVVPACQTLVAAVALCLFKSSATHVFATEVDKLRYAIQEMADAQEVAFPVTRIGAIENWAVTYEHGIALGEVLRFEQGESRVSLAKSLVFREQYQILLGHKKRLCDSILGEIKTLQAAINDQATKRRQAQLARVGFDSSIIEGLSAQLPGLQQRLQQANMEHAAMIGEYKKLEGPIAPQFNKLLQSYDKAAVSVRRATRSDLDEMCALLGPRAAQTDGFAENVLLVGAMIRRGLDMDVPREKDAVEQLEKSAVVSQSSKALGLSPINMDRMVFSIMCETGEKLSEEVSFVKKNPGSRSDPGVLYMLGTYHGAKGQCADAKRYLRSARAKIKKDPHVRAIISSEIIFYELCADETKDLDDLADFVEDVVSFGGGEAESPVLDWQISRGLAVIDAMEGNFRYARRRVGEAITVAPPRVRSTLDEMGRVYAREERFLLTSTKK